MILLGGTAAPLAAEYAFINFAIYYLDDDSKQGTFQCIDISNNVKDQFNFTPHQDLIDGYGTGGTIHQAYFNKIDTDKYDIFLFYYKYASSSDYTDTLIYIYTIDAGVVTFNQKITTPPFTQVPNMLFKGNDFCVGCRRNHKDSDTNIPFRLTKSGSTWTLTDSPSIDGGTHTYLVSNPLKDSTFYLYRNYDSDMTKWLKSTNGVSWSQTGYLYSRLFLSEMIYFNGLYIASGVNSLVYCDDIAGYFNIHNFTEYAATSYSDILCNDQYVFTFRVNSSSDRILCFRTTDCVNYEQFTLPNILVYSINGNYISKDSNGTIGLLDFYGLGAYSKDNGETWTTFSHQFKTGQIKCIMVHNP